MSEKCTHDCSSCSSDCAERTKESMFEPANKKSKIKKVIAVVSGKGGVGKSLVTSLLACAMQRKGCKTAILDADITGPSIPKSFGINDKAMGEAGMIMPAESISGIEIMSINMLLEDETQPVVWRGALISGTVKQFWTDVCWGNVDYMFVDMPPGTGDVPLTVYQSLPIDGVVIVSTPQELVAMIVEKAVNMAKMMNIPILGLVENMSYYECPKCHEKLDIFGKSQVETIAKKFGIATFAKIPVKPELAQKCDDGAIEIVIEPWLDNIVGAITGLSKRKN